MADQPDIKKQLEAAIGHEIDADAAPFWKNFWSLAGSYTDITSGGTQPFVTWRSLIAALPKHCDLSHIVDAAGIAMTGSEGKSVFRLSQFVCLGYIYTSANVVATPLSQKPVFLTVEHTLVDEARDVEIKVSTWDANGAAAPNVTFDWRCRVSVVDIIL
jgi:hypothetical protein